MSAPNNVTDIWKHIEAKKYTSLPYFFLSDVRSLRERGKNKEMKKGALILLGIATFLGFGTTFVSFKARLSLIIVYFIILVPLAEVVRYKKAVIFDLYDEESGYRRSPENTLSGTHKLSRDEMDKYLNFSNDITETTDNILGTMDGQLVTVKKGIPSNKHKLLIALSGGGKGTCTIIPDTLQAIARGESVVVSSVKDDVYRIVAPIAEKAGYVTKVIDYDPDDIIHSDGTNYLGLITSVNTGSKVEDNSKKNLVAETLANAIMMNNCSNHDFWFIAGTNLLNFALLYIAEDKTRPMKERTLGEVYRFLASYPSVDDMIADMEEKLTKDHVGREAWNSFISAPPQARPSALTNCQLYLKSLQSELVKQVVSSNDVDLAEPGRKPCAYFVITPAGASSYKWLSAMFFSMLFMRLKDVARNEGGEDTACPTKVNIILDEIQAVGAIPEFESTINTVRDQGISITMAAQNFSQFEELYGKESGDAIIGNCATQVYYQSNDTATAEHWTTLGGSETVLSPTKDPLGNATGYREQKRELYPVDYLTTSKNQRTAVVYVNGIPSVFEVRQQAYYEPYPGSPVAIRNFKTGDMVNMHPLMIFSHITPIRDHLAPWAVKLKELDAENKNLNGRKNKNNNKPDSNGAGDPKPLSNNDNDDSNGSDNGSENGTGANSGNKLTEVDSNGGNGSNANSNVNNNQRNRRNQQNDDKGQQERHKKDKANAELDEMFDENNK